MTNNQTRTHKHPLQQPPSQSHRDMGDNAATFVVTHPMPSTPAPVDEPADGKIPRPPNSWILYRADMSQALAAQNPSSSRSQADISKIISDMWKAIHPDLKAEYERRAELKKIQHAAKYPNYRYNPKSKAEKDREREEKRQLKAEGRLGAKRPKRRTSPVSEAQNSPAIGTLPFPLSATSPAPIPSRYGLAGPSPPLSAANSPSPIPLPPYYYVQPGAAEQQFQPQYFLQGPSSNQPQPDHHRSSSRRPRQDDPLYMVARKQHQQQKQQPYQIAQPEQDQRQPAPSAQQVDAPLFEGSNTDVPSEAIERPAELVEDTFSFNLPDMASNIMDAWTFDNPEFQFAYDNALNNPAGNDCFQLQMDPFSDLTDSGRPFEVELGQLFSLANIPIEDPFNYGWDPSALAQQNLVLPADTDTISSLIAGAVGATENVAGPSSQPPAEMAASTSQSHRNVSGSNRTASEEFADFLDLDFIYAPPAPVAQSQPLDMPQPTPQCGTYQPPPGAPLASFRRVAASWDHSFALVDS